MLACSCKLYHSFLTDIDRSVTNLKAGRAEAHYLGTSSRSLLSFQSSNRMTYNSKQAAESTASSCAQTDERTFSALMEFGPQPQLYYLISEWDKESGSVGRHWSVYSPAVLRHGKVANANHDGPQQSPLHQNGSWILYINCQRIVCTIWKTPICDAIYTRSLTVLHQGNIRRCKATTLIKDPMHLGLLSAYWYLYFHPEPHRPILCKQCMHNFHIGFILSVHHLPAFPRINQTFE